jgi:hypothetical protein
MAERAAQKQTVVEAEEITRRAVEHERYRAERNARILAEGLEVLHFEGACDVCGAQLTMDHCFQVDGLIDYGIESDGRMYTWRRHYATAPVGANPDCAIYSSRVWTSAAMQ